MKKAVALAWGFYCCAACQKDGGLTSEDVDYEYHAHIQSPLPNQKSLGDTIAIQVAFESHAGRPVHHISVQIYEAASEKIVYDQPAVSAIGVNEVRYDFKDSFVLNQENGVEANRDWKIKARVWGEEEGDGEISQQLQFRVVP